MSGTPCGKSCRSAADSVVALADTGAMANIRNDKRRPAGPWAAGVLAGLVGVALGAGLRRRGRARGASSAVQQLAALRAHTARQAQAAQQLDHDLRAPVGAMAVALELLRTTDDPALRHEAMQVLERQIARMHTLTQQLHEISREFNG